LAEQDGARNRKLRGNSRIGYKVIHWKNGISRCAVLCACDVLNTLWISVLCCVVGGVCRRRTEKVYFYVRCVPKRKVFVFDSEPKKETFRPVCVPEEIVFIPNGVPKMQLFCSIAAPKKWEFFIRFRNGMYFCETVFNDKLCKMLMCEYVICTFVCMPIY
jgi:hypothetical protein